MRFFSVILLCLIMAVSCQTAEVTDVTVVEKYVLSSSSKESLVTPETVSVHEEESPAQSYVLESNDVQETNVKQKESDTQEENETQSNEDTIVVYEELPGKVEDTKKEEDTVIILEDQNNREEDYTSLFEVINESEVNERLVTGDKNIKERLYIFFDNNKLYCIGLITMLLGVVFLTITVITHPVEKRIKVVHYKKEKEMSTDTVSKKKDTETYEGNSSDSVITNEEFLKTLLKS